MPCNLMTFRKLSIFLASVLLLSSCSLLAPNVNVNLAELREGQYRLDPNHAALLFRVSHLGLSSFIGRFNEFDASLDFDPNAMHLAKLEAVVDTSSIDTNNAELDNTLRTSSWLDTTTYPEATFKSRTVTAQGDGFLFTGDLTLHGITRTVSLQGRFIGGAVNRLNGRYTLGFSARGQIKRSEFGIDSYLAMIGDEINLEIDVEFLRQ